MPKRIEQLNGIAALYRARQLAELGTAPTDDGFRERYPNLFSLLTNSKVDDRTVADGAFLRLSNASGDWVLSVGVPSIGAYAEVMSQTFEAGIAKLEANLAAGNVDWRFNLKRRPRIRKLESPEKTG